MTIARTAWLLILLLPPLASAAAPETEPTPSPDPGATPSLEKRTRASLETYRGIEPRRVSSKSLVTGAESRHVLDPVLQGDVVHHTFRIPNPGPEPLELRDVTVCSGCIPAGHSKRIPPGLEGSISILVTTDWLGGRGISSPVTARTSSPEMPQLVIHVELEVREFAALEPYRVWLRGSASAAEPVTATCRVVPNEAYPFSITGIRTRRGVWFEHSLAEVEHEGRRAFEITLLNTRAKPGPYQDVLFVQTDHPERPELRIRVEGRIDE